LERRLHTRAQDSEAVIAGRMAKAVDEMSHWAEYDYVVINRDLDQAFADVQAILAAERRKRDRQTGLSTFVRGLQAEVGKFRSSAPRDRGCGRCADRRAWPALL